MQPYRRQFTGDDGPGEGTGRRPLAGVSGMGRDADRAEGGDP
jgi:hypothetical protein